ncbi:NAD(P)H-dependent flavin oxidoreductase [Oceanospirillum sediminis]|nr:nitronate monooxygenase [Oceanospirillum sediminis]
MMISSVPSERSKHFLPSELPVIQAPMAGSQGSALVVAVSEAGGLGSLPCAMLSSEQLDLELSRITQATARAFNVNFFCHLQPEPDPTREQKWLERMSVFYREFDIDPASIKPAAGRLPFSAESAEILECYKPAVVSFHFGLPAKALLNRVKSWGSMVLSSATTVEEAVWLQEHGVDAIIAQGVEAGGHRGMFLTDDLNSQSGTETLLRNILQSTDLPVIAAGGIANENDVKQLIDAGASAVQAGTAYLLCPEAATSEIHRAALQSDAACNTELTNLFSGRPARGIRNHFMEQVGPLSADVPVFPRATSFVAPLRAAAEKQQSGDFSPLWAGQNALNCEALPAAELTRKLVSRVSF